MSSSTEFHKISNMVEEKQYILTLVITSIIVHFYFHYSKWHLLINWYLSPHLSVQIYNLKYTDRDLMTYIYENEKKKMVQAEWSVWKLQQDVVQAPG